MGWNDWLQSVRNLCVTGRPAAASLSWRSGRDTISGRADMSRVTEQLEDRSLLSAPPQVLDVAPGAASSNPGNFLVINDTLFFTATTQANGTELWKTDGTVAGTVLVNDIVPGASSSTPSNLTNVNGTLFFSVSISGSDELWKSDGTSSGTVRIKSQLNTDSGSHPNSFANLNGTLLFSTNRQLWRSDGTESGTVVVDAPINWLERLTVVGDSVFFAAIKSDNSTGRELWKTDGTSTGTVLVKDISPGRGWSDPFDLVNVGGTLFFQANDGTHGLRVWKSDGTTDGTSLVGDDHLYIQNLQSFGNKLFFVGADKLGFEPWVSNGTPAGTYRLGDLNPGQNSSWPYQLVTTEVAFFFSADSQTGRGVWRSDGTPEGTIQITPSTSIILCHRSNSGF